MIAPRIWFDKDDDKPGQNDAPSVADMLWGMAGSCAIVALYLLLNWLYPAPPVLP